MVAIDIPCPQCGRSDSLEKVDIGQYRCRACEHMFSQADIDV